MTTTAPTTRRLGSHHLCAVDPPTSGADVAVADTASPLSGQPQTLPATEEVIASPSGIDLVEFYKDQAILNGDEVKVLRAEMVTLRSLLGREQRERANLQRQLDRYEKGAALRAAIIEWFITDADDLVIELEGEEAFLILNAWEEPAKYAARYAKFEVAALYGGDLLSFLRRRCPCCRDVDACRYGCGGESTDVVLPKKVADLMAEVRRANRPTEVRA